MIKNNHFSGSYLSTGLAIAFPKPFGDLSFHFSPKLSRRLVDKILSEQLAPDEINLSDIERAAVSTGDKFREVIAQHLLEETRGGRRRFTAQPVGSG
jgi:hypothetical protein